ncbi:MAG: hypothetical protein Q7S23_06020 [bacterium]|nr:hypothetical protein [bacterium]
MGTRSFDRVIFVIIGVVPDIDIRMGLIALRFGRWILGAERFGLGKER